MDDGHEISASQDSLEPLSQETMNTLIYSLGGQSAISGLIANEFERIQTPRDEDDEDGMNSGLGPEDAEVQVSRTIIHSIPGAPTLMPQWPASQGLSQGTLLPTTNGFAAHPTPPLLTHVSTTPTLTAHQTPGTCHNGGMETESPLMTTSASALTPSFSTYPPSTPTTPVTPTPTTPVTPIGGTPGPSNPATSNTSRLPFPGEYGFNVDFGTEEKKVSKTTNFTYSRKVSRAYIKPKCPITFTFAFQESPPVDSILRATPIYNSPELNGQFVYCCLADSHQIKESGQLFSSHFIRPYDTKTAIFCGNGSDQASSVVLPFQHLTQKSSSVWYTVYQFPCVTSHLPHKKHVEIMFTLEHNQAILGRCLVPIRVCTSPGRDRTLDEKKAAKEGKEEQSSPETRPSRKRGAENMTEVTQVIMPPKRPCVRLSMPKVDYTIRTHPELIPYIDVCVRMMEQVYSVPQPVAPYEQPPTQRKEMFGSVDEWLEHIGLNQYSNMFREKGITRLFQVAGLSEEDLKKWGIRTVTHRKKIITEKDNVIQTVKGEDSVSTPSSVEQDGNSPPLFPSLSPPNPAPSAQPSYLTRQEVSKPWSQGSGNSQLSNASTYTQSFEVVQIQLKKKLSNSSSNSGPSQK